MFDLSDNFRTIIAAFGFDYQLELIDAELLYNFAKYGYGNGCIVEIGTWSGRSACFLALGSQEAKREKIYSIDINPQIKHDLIINQKDYIEFITGNSKEIGKNWDRPIRLLFIDGDHSYEGAKGDFVLFEKHVIINGTIILHDATPAIINNPEYGVRKMLEDFIIPQNRFLVQYFDSMNHPANTVVLTKLRE